MAKYTIELRSIIDAGIPIFNFPYEYYKEKDRKEFEQNFIRHFYFREIGCETIDKFRLFLEDKFTTVFPYYNELLKYTEFEYDKIRNYDVVEEYTTLSETSLKSHDRNSSVSQSFTDETSNTSQEKDTMGTGTASTITTTQNTQNFTGETEKNGTTETTQDIDSSNRKTFLDTPQGILNLSDSQYATNITQDDGSQATNTEQTNTETVNTNNVTTDNGNTTTNQDTTNKENLIDNINSNSSQEQKGTLDSDSKTQTEGAGKETSKRTMKGNIGVQTTADILEREIELQKKLKRIISMFFDDCEDLFMGVY